MSSSEQLLEQLGQLRHEKCLGVWGNATPFSRRLETPQNPERFIPLKSATSLSTPSAVLAAGVRDWPRSVTIPADFANSNWNGNRDRPIFIPMNC